MRELTPAGRQALEDIAGRHGFSVEAALVMLRALAAGGGAMAQFAHPEFSGSGQWMRGGMIMISDVFNAALKSRIDALCTDLGALLASRPERQAAAASAPFAPAGNDAGWWPRDLGMPNATGVQNEVRYAYFAAPRRLAIEQAGRVTVYDTQDHRIGGFAQQQPGGAAVFTSQHGGVNVASLSVVGRSEPPSARAEASPDAAGDVFGAIEKLAELHRRGILSDDEFSRKKAELLNRI